MITRVIHGRAYLVHSPSLFEVVIHNDTDDPDARVFLKYAGQYMWELIYVRGNGQRVYRRFRSLEHATSVIAGRVDYVA